ncbi:MAG: beta-glucosidase, partial [Pseudomonadota bacterium]
MRHKLLKASLFALAGMALHACQAVDTTAIGETETVMESSVPALSSDPEIAALIADMTLDEKLAQLSCIWINKGQILDSNGDFSPEKMAANYPHGVGCFARPQDTMGMEVTEERK